MKSNRSRRRPRPSTCPPAGARGPRGPGRFGSGRRIPARPLALLSLLPALLVAGPALAQEGGFVPVYHPEMTVTRAAGAIRIDGELGDPGWRGAARAANFAEHAPGDQVQPPVDTEAFMTYDDENVYIAFVCHDDPALVRATLCERDRIWSDDYIIVALDTYGSQTWAYEIASNPHGIQGDLLWSANGGEDSSYDMIYRTAGKVTGIGYVVEMAIPFTSLRFPGAEEQVWRMDFWRNHPREMRGQYSWAAYDRDEACWPCQWGTVRGIRGVEPGKGIEVLPSLVARQSGGRNGAGAWDNEDAEGDVALGFKYALSSSATAEATFNPDFSQVESDADQIDVNTTFALWYPEKRPFFQEGSDMFTTFFTTVYTRSINDPVFAAKLTGRPGNTSFAFLVARDEHSPLLVPFEESSELVPAGESTTKILRAQHALGEGSHLGFITTDRILDDGGSNTVLGADGRIRLDQKHQIEWQALATHTQEPDAPALSEDFEVDTFDDGRHTAAFDGEAFWGRAFYASLERSSRNWSYDLDYWDRGAAFRADNGFEPQNDSREGILYSEYIVYPEDGLVEWWSQYVQGGFKWNQRGVKKDQWVRINLGCKLKWAQTNLHAQYLYSDELFQDIQFDRIYSWHVCSSSVWSDWLRTSMYGNHGHRIARGDLVMGEQTDAGFWFTLKPVDRLTLEADIDWIKSDDVATGRRLFEGFVSRARLDLQLTRELSTRLVLQYNDFAERWEADPLITYRLNPFSIFYVGSTRDYRDLNVAEHGVDGWRLTDRQYFMKLQYLFQL